jgi:tetratricopeptide (TPR) repeat protein
MLGEALTFDGQPARGLPYIDKAILLSPKSPYMYFYEFYRTMALCELDRYFEAEQAGQNSLKSYDGLYWSWLVLAWARAGQGDIEGAQQALYGAKNIEPRFSLDLAKETTAITFKNKGKNMLALLEPIWPEDLLTAD